jgi:NAD(P)-dependent dehydrogenase (short-subunit alcohol dehydrogenase family)
MLSLGSLTGSLFVEQLRHAIPRLREAEGKVVFTTSAAGEKALFAGWGFYGLSKAAVAFEVKQLHIEEPSLTVLGLSPGLCDTKMVRGLMEGACESQPVP